MKLVLVQPELSYDPQADNLGALARLLAPRRGSLEADDIVLLPEHVDLREARAPYEAGVCAIARELGCHVVGGSHHEARDGARINAGVVASGEGQIISRYEKLRPYADERARVQPGAALGELVIGGRRVLILICADFWFSDLLYQARGLPDLVLVPAHSVSRKPTPDYSRSLWRHLAVARAYEFGVYVGISDWAYAPAPGRLAASGVSGLADPTTVDPARLFLPIEASQQLFALDFGALDAFRRDRKVRGFFWRK